LCLIDIVNFEIVIKLNYLSQKREMATRAAPAADMEAKSD